MVTVRNLRALTQADTWRALVRDRHGLAGATVLVAGLILQLLALYSVFVAAVTWTGLLLGLAGTLATLSLAIDANEDKKRRLFVLVSAALGASLSLMSLGAASVGTGIGLIPALGALIASAALVVAALGLVPEP